jgi:hypothetical protein
MSGLTGTITRLQKNPIWVFAWSLLTLAVGYTIQHEYTQPEVIAAFFQRHTELEHLQSTYLRGEQMVQIWHQALTQLADSAEAMNSRIPDASLRSPQLGATTDSTLVWFRRQRELLNQPIATLRAMTFDDASLQALHTQLLNDLLVADSIAERRVHLLQLMAHNPNGARSAAPGVFHNIDEVRQVLEGSGRDVEIDRVLEQARMAFNTAVRADKAERTMFTARSRAAVAAWTYIGCFIGAVIGYKVASLRAPKRKRRETTSPRSTGTA